MSGKEALEAIVGRTQNRICEFGLILTDLSMPIMDGYEFASNCRTLFCELEEKPMIVALTGHTESEYYLAAFEKGINKVYSKPVSCDKICLLLLECGYRVNPTKQISELVSK